MERKVTEIFYESVPLSWLILLYSNLEGKVLFEEAG